MEDTMPNYPAGTITHDPSVNTSYIYWQKFQRAARCVELAPGVNLDYDADGNLIGIELLWMKGVKVRLVSSEEPMSFEPEE